MRRLGGGHEQKEAATYAAHPHPPWSATAPALPDTSSVQRSRNASTRARMMGLSR